MTGASESEPIRIRTEISDICSEHCQHCLLTGFRTLAKAFWPISRRYCMPSNEIVATPAYARVDGGLEGRARVPTTVSTRPPAVTIAAGLSSSFRSERRRRRRARPPASRPSIGDARLGSTPDTRATRARRRRDLSWLERERDDAGSAPSAARPAARQQIAVDQRQHDLRLGIAEPDVELDDLRAVARQHQPGVEKAAILVAFGAHPRSTGSTISRMMRASQRGVEQRARRERAHAAGVRPLVAVEDALVILRRADRRARAAVAQREERHFRAAEAFLDHDASAGVAELLLVHRARGSRRRLPSRSAATTTPLPAARPSALSTTGSRARRSAITSRASAAMSQTR